MAWASGCNVAQDISGEWGHASRIVGRRNNIDWNVAVDQEDELDRRVLERSTRHSELKIRLRSSDSLELCGCVIGRYRRARCESLLLFPLLGLGL